MSSLSQDIAARISGAILAHRLTPATKLGERELGEVLGASRIVVRQALQASNMADGADCRTADLAHTLGNIVRHCK